MKHKKHSLIPLLCTLFLCSVFLSGCSMEGIHSMAQEPAMDTISQLQEIGSENASREEQEWLAKKEAERVSRQTVAKVSLVSKRYGDTLIGVSFAIGFILWLIATKTNAAKLRRTAICTFIIAIPTILFLLIRGSSVLTIFYY